MKWTACKAVNPQFRKPTSQHPDRVSLSLAGTWHCHTPTATFCHPSVWILAVHKITSPSRMTCWATFEGGGWPVGWLVVCNSALCRLCWVQCPSLCLAQASRLLLFPLCWVFHEEQLWPQVLAQVLQHPLLAAAGKAGMLSWCAGCVGQIGFASSLRQEFGIWGFVCC